MCACVVYARMYAIGKSSLSYRDIGGLFYLVALQALLPPSRDKDA